MLEEILKFERTEEGLVKLYDRFSFDQLFRLLLISGYEREEALNFILCNCALSALVFQERIYNCYYLNIQVDEVISPDLLELKRQCLIKIMANSISIKNYICPVSLWIRECDPKTMRDWESFYYKKLAEMLKQKGINLSPQEYIQDLGRKLHTKITEVIQAEIEEVTEEDCLQYIYNLVINRTLDGYQTEIKTIYGKLQRDLGVKIEPAPDEWDRSYDVDFYIQVGSKYIGLQIKPITYEQTPEVYRWKEWLGKTHDKFERDKGGKVFIVFSIKKEGKKAIYNPEVIDEIKKEIHRLRNK